MPLKPLADDEDLNDLKCNIGGLRFTSSPVKDESDAQARKRLNSVRRKRIPIFVGDLEDVDENNQQNKALKVNRRSTASTSSARADSPVSNESDNDWVYDVYWKAIGKNDDGASAPIEETIKQLKSAEYEASASSELQSPTSTGNASLTDSDDKASNCEGTSRIELPSCSSGAITQSWLTKVTKSDIEADEDKDSNHSLEVQPSSPKREDDVKEEEKDEAPAAAEQTASTEDAQCSGRAFAHSCVRDSNSGSDTIESGSLSDLEAARDDDSQRSALGSGGFSNLERMRDDDSILENGNGQNNASFASPAANIGFSPEQLRRNLVNEVHLRSRLSAIDERRHQAYRSIRPNGVRRSTPSASVPTARVRVARNACNQSRGGPSASDLAARLQNLRFTNSDEEESVSQVLRNAVSHHVRCSNALTEEEILQTARNLHRGLSRPRPGPPTLRPIGSRRIGVPYQRRNSLESDDGRSDESGEWNETDATTESDAFADF